MMTLKKNEIYRFVNSIYGESSHAKRLCNAVSASEDQVIEELSIDLHELKQKLGDISILIGDLVRAKKTGKQQTKRSGASREFDPRKRASIGTIRPTLEHKKRVKVQAIKEQMHGLKKPSKNEVIRPSVEVIKPSVEIKRRKYLTRMHTMPRDRGKRHRHIRSEITRRGRYTEGLVNMTASLFQYGSVKTTLPKAEQIRRIAEPLIALEISDTSTNRHFSSGWLSNPLAVSKLLEEVGPRYKPSYSGYVRVLKCGFRPGDQKPMAYVELINRPQKKRLKTDLKE